MSTFPWKRKVPRKRKKAFKKSWGSIGRYFIVPKYATLQLLWSKNAAVRGGMSMHYELSCYSENDKPRFLRRGERILDELLSWAQIQVQEEA